MHILAVEKTSVKLWDNAVLWHMHQQEIKISTTDNNLVWQEKRKGGNVPNALEIVVRDSVKVITDLFIGYNAMVWGDSYGSEVEIQYFTEKKDSSSQTYLQCEREWFWFLWKTRVAQSSSTFHDFYRIYTFLWKQFFQNAPLAWTNRIRQIYHAPFWFCHVTFSFHSKI